MQAVNTAKGATDWKQVVMELSKRTPKKTMAYHLDVAVIDKINQICQGKCISRSALVNRLLREALDI